MGSEICASSEGRQLIDGCTITGATTINHMQKPADRETTQENGFMQYFLGHSSFAHDEPFHAGLFAEIREQRAEP